MMLASRNVRTSALNGWKPDRSNTRTRRNRGVGPEQQTSKREEPQVQLVNHAVINFFMWLRSERGQDLLEYALLSGLIAAAIIAILTAGILSGGVNSMVTNIRDCIDFQSSSVCDISLP